MTVFGLNPQPLHTTSVRKWGQRGGTISQSPAYEAGMLTNYTTLLYNGFVRDESRFVSSLHQLASLWQRGGDSYVGSCIGLRNHLAVLRCHRVPAPVSHYWHLRSRQRQRTDLERSHNPRQIAADAREYGLISSSLTFLLEPQLSVRYSDEMIFAFSAASACPDFAQAFNQTSAFVAICKPADFAYWHPVVPAGKLHQPCGELFTQCHICKHPFWCCP